MYITIQELTCTMLAAPPQTSKYKSSNNSDNKLKALEARATERTPKDC